MADASDNLIGRTINDYCLIRELGRGSNGVVYLARQEILDRKVAFKVLLPEWVETPGYLKNFLREAKLAAKLDHPNIVQALEAGNTLDGLHYFVMEYVPGSTVEEIRTDAPERLSLKFILEMSIQLADALAYAWNSRQLIHGDIKPGNLLIRNGDNMLKLADLGLARIGSDVLDAGDIMATPMYVAPEIVAGQRVSFPADIYSFGVMFYELAAGSAPFDGTMEELLEAHLHQEVSPLIEANPDIDVVLSDFVGRMLQKRAEDRPGSWEEVRDFFRGLHLRFYPASLPDGRKKSAVSGFRELLEEKRQRRRLDPRWEKYLRIGIYVLCGISLLFFLIMLWRFR